MPFSNDKPTARERAKAALAKRMGKKAAAQAMAPEPGQKQRERRSKEAYLDARYDAQLNQQFEDRPVHMEVSDEGVAFPQYDSGMKQTGWRKSMYSPETVGHEQQMEAIDDARRSAEAVARASRMREQEEMARGAIEAAKQAEYERKMTDMTRAQEDAMERQLIDEEIAKITGGTGVR